MRGLLQHAECVGGGRGKGGEGKQGPFGEDTGGGHLVSTLLNLVAQLLCSRLNLGSQLMSLLRNLVGLIIHLLQVWLNLVSNQNEVILELRGNLQIHQYLQYTDAGC